MVENGNKVEEGQHIAEIDVMKLQQTIKAPENGTLMWAKGIEPGSKVLEKQLLCSIIKE